MSSEELRQGRLALNAGKLGANRKLRIQAVGFEYRRDLATLGFARDGSITVGLHIATGGNISGADRDGVAFVLDGANEPGAHISVHATGAVKLTTSRGVSYLRRAHDRSKPPEHSMTLLIRDPTHFREVPDKDVWEELKRGVDRHVIVAPEGFSGTPFVSLFLADQPDWMPPLPRSFMLLHLFGQLREKTLHVLSFSAEEPGGPDGIQFLLDYPWAP